MTKWRDDWRGVSLTPMRRAAIHASRRDDDAYASLEHSASGAFINVEPMTGHPDRGFPVSAREARVLAVRLLAAADEIDPNGDDL